MLMGWQAQKQAGLHKVLQEEDEGPCPQLLVINTQIQARVSLKTGSDLCTIHKPIRAGQIREEGKGKEQEGSWG